MMFAALAWSQPAGKGSITGIVYDSSISRPIPQVSVVVVELPDSKTVTDLDGKYRLDVPAGTYHLRFSATNYHEAILDGVIVAAGANAEASTVMANTANVTKIDVVESVGAVAATAEAMLADRKLSPVVSDSLSNEEIRRGVASDAAGALEKVTGVSIVDNGFVFVRGLGERYSATMLNNAIIPTTEPERRVVPLDLFPSALIDNIRVLKTYSVDLPGEFSGGLVQMQTVEFPKAKTFSFSANYGFNTVTTFNSFNSFGGGGLDWAGFDNGSRALPGSIPADKRLFVGNFSETEFQKFGRDLTADYETKPISSMRPMQTYSVVGGNTWGRLGVVGALTFSNSPQRIPQMQRFLVNSGGGKPQVFSDYSKFNSDTEAVRLGGVLNVAFRATPNHKFVLRNTITRDTDKEARFIQGLSGGSGNYIQDTRIGWVERALYSTTVEGEHVAPGLGNSLFTWQLTYSKSKRDEPDLRETIYGLDADSGTYSFLNLPESGVRMWSKLHDKIYEPQATWGKPFALGGVNAMFKMGFRATTRRRDFASRRFRYFAVRPQTIDFEQPVNTVLGAANIRPDGFVVREITRGTDSYDASMDVYGGFAMVDMALGSRWRLIAGLRYEDADIRVETIDPLVPGGIPAIATLSNRDPLPAVNLIYALTPRQNLRFGYGRTVNRPDFRELSPFEFTNVVGGYSTVGNPDLQRALIGNYDMRWEWFMSGNQLLAASYFFKSFTDPIEQIYKPTASELRQSFLNVDGARNQGVELELRKGLGAISRHLSPFALQGNFTFVDSKVNIPTERFPQLTSRTRPLVGQSRYIYNFITEWSKPKWGSNARFYVNSVSRRITDVGTFQLPDVYQERSVFMDVVYQFAPVESKRWSIRVSAENLTNNHYRYSQSDILVRSFRIGRTFTVGTTFNFF